MPPTTGFELPTVTDEDVVPSRSLWIELSTRVTTERLHYRSGDEETAAGSIYSLFKKSRSLMESNPEASAFANAAVFMLNRVIRPYTARWHRWMADEKFKNEAARRRFRRELLELQPKLGLFRDLLDALSKKETPGEKLLNDLAAAGAQSAGCAFLGDKISAGIGEQIHFAGVTQPDAINRAEHKRLYERRKRIGNLQAGDSEANIVSASGMALSGGGIRSATFCLGFVQELARRKMIQQIDYLSTVSGGGYLGSFITSYLGTDPEQKEPDESETSIQERLEKTFGKEYGHESGAIRHLRNNSRYLMNGGVWGKISMAGLLVGGILLNILIVLPIPILSAVFVAAIEAAGYWEPDSWKFLEWLPEWMPEALVLPSGVVLLVSASLFALGWFWLPFVQATTEKSPPLSRGAKFRGLWESGTLIVALSTLVAGAMFILPSAVESYMWLRNWRPTLPGIDQLKSHESLVALIAGMAPVILGFFAAAKMSDDENVESEGFVQKAARILFGLSGIILYLLVFFGITSRLLPSGDVQPEWRWWVVACAAGGLAIWTLGFVNINALSPHRFYRARLCDCYLATQGKEQTGLLGRMTRTILHGEKLTTESPGSAQKGNIHTVKRLPLTKIGNTLAAPYHLINATINLPTSKEKNLRGRNADFYLFSREYCGSPIATYVPTEALESVDPHLDLGTAMAISGAAASANMGVLTLSRFRILMALLNIRLSYWLPRHGRKSSGLGPGPWYLLREMTGWMHERCRFLNVSDGGHIDNLGVYELLRRRCKFIIAIDGSRDPDLLSRSLMTIQRYAAIDLKAQIKIDLSDLERDERGLSRSNAVLGKICYDSEPGDDKPCTSVGWLLYIKLTVTGSEPGYVQDYQLQEPQFPHQSTGDQLFDEAQFEAYRALGENAAMKVFDDELLSLPDTGSKSEPDLREWFECLATNLLPDNDDAFRR